MIFYLDADKATTLTYASIYVNTRTTAKYAIYMFAECYPDNAFKKEGCIYFFS
jgi:hypothetical protein